MNRGPRVPLGPSRTFGLGKVPCWLAVLVAFHWASLAHAQPQPNGKIIAEVVITGNRAVSTQHISNQLRSRTGTPYNQATVQEDVNRLAAMKAFSQIRAEYKVLPNDQVRLTIALAELRGTVQQIIYDGAKHISDDELNNITGLRLGVPLSPAVAYAGGQAILRKYQEMGRVYATVELIEGGEYTDNRVVYRITEGPKVKIGSVKFTGNHFVVAGRLNQQITISAGLNGLFGGDYNPLQIDFDVTKLEEFYRTFGFQDVKITRQVQFSDDQKWAYVTFHINEGPRYHVRSVRIEGNRTYDEALLMSYTRLKAGEVYDRNVVQADLNTIRDKYGMDGRAVSVREQVFQTGPGELSVHYNIEERPPARVGQVLIVGNTTTRDNVIRRAVPLYPGQILTYPNLRVAEDNLARLGIFEMKPDQGIRPTVTVLDPEGESPIKDVLVQVQEAPTGSFMIGLGVNSDAGLSGSIVLNERNFDWTRVPLSLEELLSGRAFRGAGQEFRLEAVPGTQFQRYTASFRDPSLFDGPYALGLSGYYFTRAFNEYFETRTGGRVTVDRRLGDYWRGSASVRVENVQIHGVSIFAPDDIFDDVGTHFLLGLRAGVTRDTRDSYLRPTSGNIIEASFEQVLGDYDFPIFTLEGSQFFTTYKRADGSGKHVLSLRSQLAIAGSQAPVFERFYAGGFRSLRGFEFRGVGPIVPGLFGNGTFNVGGELSVLNTIEYQIPILANDQVFFVSFLDSGAVERNLEINDYRVTAGFGFRLVVPMLGPVPIALDFGFPIVKAEADRKQIFSFWMGFFN